MARRVVVTGLGLVTPVGNTVKESWENILAGKSGIAPIEHFDATGFNTRFGGSVKNFDISPYLNPKDARKMDLFIQYGVAAGAQAISDAGIECTDENAERIGVAIGSGIGGLPMIEQNHNALNKGGGASRVAVLRARLDHQHDFRQPGHPAWLQGSEHCHHHGLYHRYPQYRL